MEELKNRFLKPTEELRSLQLLEEIAKDSSISQRKLSQRLGVALGVTNACLKKMINKGLLKVRGINHRRIGYYLTPKGFTEKTKLTYHFLEHTIKYYSRLKDNISAKLSALSGLGHRRIICYGAGEVMEVAFIILNEGSFDFLVLAIVDDAAEKQGRTMFGTRVEAPSVIAELKPDAVLVTSTRYKEDILRNLQNKQEFSGINFYAV